MLKSITCLLAPSSLDGGFRCRVSRLRSVELRRGKQLSGKKNKNTET